MDLYGLAQSIYRENCDDPHAMATFREASKSLGISMLTGGDGTLQITSGTMNGSTFSGIHKLNTVDRKKVLGLIIAMDDAGMVPSKTTIPNFDGNS